MDSRQSIFLHLENCMNNIIIDTDAGADDLLAILYALSSYQLNIKAIITSYGNFSLEESTTRVSNFLSALQLKNNLPIIKGAKKPLKNSFSYSYLIHGKSLLKKTNSMKSFLHDFSHKFNFFNNSQKLSQSNGMFDYVCLGPLTNLANISNTSHTEKIKRIIILGGTLYFPGNATAVSEANFHWDPHAVKQVLKLQIPIYIIPLNISEQYQISLHQIKKLKYNFLLQKIFKEYISYYIDQKQYYSTFPENERIRYKGGTIHDVLPIAFLKYIDIFHFKKMPVSLEYIEKIPGFIYPVLRKEQLSNKSNILVNIAIKMDKQLFWRDFYKTLGK